ncbi:MAG: autotransporter domain-containing protein, partial [Stappiaceae bacterium]
MIETRSTLLLGTVAGVTLTTLLLSGGQRTHAQAICSAGSNLNACVVPEDTTIAGRLDTFRDGSSIDVQGTVTGIVNTASPNSGVTNSGRIGGNLQTNSSNSSVMNSGTVDGFINTVGTGSDIVNSGSVGGSVRALGGDANIVNSGRVEDFLLTSGVNSGITNTRFVGSYISTALENSAVTNTGTVGTFIGTSGNSSSVVNTGSVALDIDTQGQNSSVTNTGNVGQNIQTLEINSGVTNSGFVGININTQKQNSGVTNNGTVGGEIETIGAGSGVYNSGTVGQAIATFGDNADIVNSGIVVDALAATGTNSVIYNSGTVGSRIESSGNNGRVVNSGLVGTGEDDDGILLDGINSYLTLLPGSIIQGEIDFSGAGTRTLNIGNGLSINNTLDFTGTPVVVIANGAVFAAADGGAGPGTRVSVVDPTNLSTQDEQLADLTGGIASARENRLSGVRNGAAGSVTTSGPYDAAAASDPNHPFWMQGFGSYRQQEAEGPAVETNQWIGGFVIGADDLLQDNLRVGFLGGAAWGGVEADFDSQETDSQSFFVGSYASLLKAGLIFDLALTAGYSDFDQERSVANNLAAGGLETATADFSGWFVSPELTITKPTVLLGRRLETSLALRYAGLF